ncbi:MAG TPA: hypothetical protein VFK79_12865 [Xanthobacteraceae bacterium]|nr:hypothetical protein [Xanthobacteraceae bacterium]
MRRMLLTAVTTMAWLLASPSLQLRDAGWIEVGAVPAAAQDSQDVKAPADIKKKSAKKKKQARRPARIGSSGIVRSNQPGFHPMQPITPPQAPDVTGTVMITPARDPRYPDVPTVPIVPRGSTAGAGIETSQDRVARCTHQGALGGLKPGEQGAYIHNCAF